MVVERAGDGGVLSSVERVLSGEKPCQLCHAIDQGRQQEQGAGRQFPVLKKVFDSKYVAHVECAVPLVRVTEEMDWERLEERAERRVFTPLAPPPRV